jgi:D-xylose reductase
MGYFSEPKKPMHVLWPEMESLVEKKLTKSIGVSNFNTQLIWDMLTYAKIKPAVNQIELNPQCVQNELVKFLHAMDIRPMAFTPVARPGAIEKGDQLVPEGWPDLRDNVYLQELAKKYNKSVVQVMLNWGLCKGHCVIPKAATLKYQIENLDVYDFQLTEDEVKKVEELDGRIRLCNKFSISNNFDVFA